MDVNGRISAPAILRRKGAGEKIAMLTAYDFTMARLLDPFVDVLLVGDSLACVVQGSDTTLPVTLDEMIYHARMVVRGSAQALVVGDMPFGAYQVGGDDAVQSAIRLVKEAGVGAVKLEGGVSVQASIERIVRSGIPVMGHIGLTPQSFHAMGGHKVQGRSQGAADRLLADARAVEDAGAFALVIEGVPADLAVRITAEIAIPTIGIGAGPGCDGQVLVINDMVGLNTEQAPMRFNKEFCAVRDQIRGAAAQFVAEVRDGSFPTEVHSFRSHKPKLRLVAGS
jgi:3-methyl-2-oxobutanoate hydroxymethyltransferase